MGSSSRNEDLLDQNVLDHNEDRQCAHYGHHVDVRCQSRHLMGPTCSQDQSSLGCSHFLVSYDDGFWDHQSQDSQG